MDSKKFTFHSSVVIIPLGFILLMWIVFYLNWRLGSDANRLGIYPREISGIRGIFFSPFLHSDIGHITNNSLALAVLLPTLYFFYKEKATKVLLWGWLLSGFGTWLLGRQGFHIGASGIIYVLTSFIFFYGMRIRYYRLTAVSFFVVLLYGSSVWYMFPEAKEGLSWEGHLAGFLTGLLLAFLLEKKSFQPQYKYDWQQPGFDETKDDFMRQFDPEGNFRPLPLLRYEDGFLYNDTFHRKLQKNHHQEKVQL